MVFPDSDCEFRATNERDEEQRLEAQAERELYRELRRAERELRQLEREEERHRQELERLHELELSVAHKENK